MRHSRGNVRRLWRAGARQESYEGVSRLIAITLILTLTAACGNRNDRERAVTRGFANPILAACLSAGRSGATRERCGCAQAVANRSLTASDQALGATFFADPHRAQVIRQSVRTGHGEFWERWKAFGAEAAKLCK